MIDWLIVGAGYVGAVAAERLARLHGQTVLVIDRRDHVGGNAHDLRNEDGILYHKYGPHIFHTNAEPIAAYLSQFTAWRDYEHRVLALVNNRLVPVPFNFTAIDIVFDAGKAARIKQRMVERYGFGSSTTILKMRSEQDGLLKDCAEFIYENIFLGYTSKQWGLRPDEIDPSVTNRVPVRVSYDDRYFQDTFQKMPERGYTAMFDRLLDAPGISVSLATTWTDVKDTLRFGNVLFTGAIDEFFDYRLGALPYRSLDFDFQVYNQAMHQPVAQVNYPNCERFTRITEMRHLTGEAGPKTMVAIEYPQDHRPGETVPYYPIPREDNEALHRRYLSLGRADNVHFAGRLADYRYYNMDQAVGRATAFVRRLSA